MNFEVSFYPVLFYPRPLSSLPIILLLFYHLSRILQWVSVLPLSLHSTIFLLIQTVVSVRMDQRPLFTFHNVSINTVQTQPGILPMSDFTFHNVSINTSETMAKQYVGTFFTFHNVSINTRNFKVNLIFTQSLHSTMFLLIQVLWLWLLTHTIVTLHSTMFLLIRGLSALQWLLQISLHSTMFLLIHSSVRSDSSVILLYIPQCFY